MSVSFTNLTSGTDSDGNSTAVTSSVTLLANRLHLLTVQSVQFDPGSTTPTCTGWTQVIAFEYLNSGSRNKITVFRQLPGSDSTGTHTIDFAGTNQGEVIWSIDQSDANVDTGGTNGSAAIVQTATGSGTGTALSATLAAFGDAANGTFGAGAVYAGGMSSWTVGTGFTALASLANGFSIDSHMLTEYRDDNDTSVDATAGSSGDWGMVAIEIKAAGGGGGAQNVLAWIRG
jgi:hypothetical protein